MDKAKKLDRFHYHEALDRSYIMCNQFTDLLVTHPVIVEHKKLRKRAEKVDMLLREIYQLMAGIDLK